MYSGALVAALTAAGMLGCVPMVAAGTGMPAACVAGALPVSGVTGLLGGHAGASPSLTHCVEPSGLV